MSGLETAEALRKSSVAIYLQLATMFKKRIETGKWPINSKIPTVEALSKECGVATMTIRQALDLLEAEGLIERFRAKGTFVKSRPKKDIWCEVHTDWSGLLIARENATIEIISNERNVKLPPIDLEKGVVADSYHYLKRCHSREGSAFLIADIYLDEEIAHFIPESAYTTMTAMRLIADIPDHPIKDAWQQLTIGAADLETATLLDIPIGEPIAKVQRVALDQNEKVILVANGIYRGDTVRIDIKLK